MKADHPLLIDHFSFDDNRGAMSMPFNDQNKKLFFDYDITLITRTKKANTVRGIYYQTGDFKEKKLITCVSGSIFWVSIDMRKDSKTFLSNYPVFLKPTDRKSYFVPEGFANGCLILNDNTVCVLASSAVHNEESSIGIHWRDQDLNIDWPIIKNQEIIISDQCKNYPTLNYNINKL